MPDAVGRLRQLIGSHTAGGHWDGGAPMSVHQVLGEATVGELADAVHADQIAPLQAERDRLAATLTRVLDAVAEHRSGPGPDATVPAGAVLAALFINPERQKLTPEIERRARELQAQIDAERTTP